MDMSTWVDNTRLFFSEDVVEIRQAKTRKKTTQKTTWPSTMLNCLGTATSEPFSFNDGETTLGVQFEPNIVPTKLNVELHQYLNLMNDNKCSTCLYFGLTMEECQQLWKAKVQTFS